MVMSHLPIFVNSFITNIVSGRPHPPSLQHDRYTRSVSECQRPDITYPTRVPLKVIGHASKMDPDVLAALIFEHVSRTPLPDTWKDILAFTARENGTWISYTFWVTLPDAQTEPPLREAIQKHPGVVMQL